MDSKELSSTIGKQTDWNTNQIEFLNNVHMERMEMMMDFLDDMYEELEQQHSNEQ